MRKAFGEAVAAYLDDPLVRSFYSDGTRARIRRNLRTVEQDLQNVNEPHGLATAPTRISEEHVAQLLLVWKGRGLDQSTQRKYLQDLDAFLTWVTGAPSILSRMRKLRHFRYPRPAKKSVKTLDQDDLNLLRATAERMDGYRGAVARFLVGFLPYTGLRPKEVLGVRLVDVNVRKRRVLVTHPKGEGVWASDEEVAALLPEAAQAFQDFLPEREKYLAGENSDWLIPLRKMEQLKEPDADGKMVPVVNGWVEIIGPWTDTVLRKLAADLRERTSPRKEDRVEFSWKTMRATFGQRRRDEGARIDEVSRAMRHASTKTTEEFYARVDADAALDAVLKAHSRPVSQE